MIHCICPNGHTWQVATRRRGWNFCGTCNQYFRGDELTDDVQPTREPKQQIVYAEACEAYVVACRKHNLIPLVPDLAQSEVCRDYVKLRNKEKWPFALYDINQRHIKVRTAPATGGHVVPSEGTES